MIWELCGFNTENPNDVRYRGYTSSERIAQSFAAIPKIQFTDSGHGIVFIASPLKGPKKPAIRGPSSCEAYVNLHWHFKHRRTP